jgi:hypothetical protein
MNNVYIYIDNIALFLLYKEQRPNFIKNLMKTAINTAIKKIITDRNNYIGDLTTFTEAYNIMGSMSDAYNALYQSIFIYQYDKKSIGGRKQQEQHKRTVGRPRKTPVKPAKKPTKKLVAKPAKKPAIKPTKPPAKKPTKPTKPTTKKPTKPTAKKPTKPTTKKPTKK